MSDSDTSKLRAANYSQHGAAAWGGAGLSTDAVAIGHDGALGLAYKVLSAQGSVASLEITAAHHQPAGIVHGGVYCAIVESLASISGMIWLNEHGVGGHVVGVNNNTDFLRAIGSGTITATARPVHRGRRQQLWDVDIVDTDDRLIAQGRVRLQNIEASSA